MKYEKSEKDGYVNQHNMIKQSTNVPKAETPLLPTALTNTELDTQPREAMDGMGQQPRNTIGQDPMINVDALMYGGGTADLMMNWNFDDWMMYSDQFWPQNLAGAESSTS